MFLKSVVVSCIIVFLVACSATEKLPEVHIEYASVWQHDNTSDNVATAMVEKNWWESFGSSQLNQLVAIAQQQNSDVLIALEHVKQAELQMKIVNASLFPTLNLNLSSGEKTTKSLSDSRQTSGSTTLGVSTNYEIDLWGGIDANRHVAKSNFNAAAFTAEATRLTIAAAVATAWFNYLALQERIETAKKNIIIAERIQKVIDSLYRNGVVTAASVAQQKTNVLTQQSALLPLQLQLDQTGTAIAILEGQVPQGYTLQDEKISAVKIPNIDAGVPVALITRRPDVASVEAQLYAASANVDAARTALLPNMQLGASIGKSASELFILNPATQVSGWSLSLAQTLFAGGSVKNKIRLNESRRAELLENYRKIILTALQEVDDALNRVAITQTQENNQQYIVLQAERSLKLVEAGYREGSNDLQALLDSQRSVFQAQDALVQQRLARIKAAIDLYKALGGGWQK